ncbi:DEBR0S5_11474g1_1 [Brettanomyces bruxellensis]|uniref:DEBR0S5_11474g1_1 n=1 Tax=Dekkera bruxellensis TaxID=5007 RepID=A0A7D9H3X9_DEKBR|nr:DEBR0S5_11474g1_1 [Brettanomyces bruxellensis]
MIDEDDRRLQRKPSRLDYLASKGQKLDIRAHQRTYQGAYVRTCLGCLSFSLLVMKLFSREFMPLGMVYQIYALVLCLASYLRSRNLDLYFINFNDPNWYNNYEVVQRKRNRRTPKMFKAVTSITTRQVETLFYGLQLLESYATSCYLFF